MRPFFEAYCKEGKYKSVQTSTINHHFFNGVDFKLNFHLVSFMKTKEQAVYALEQLQGSDSDKTIVESRFSTNESGESFFNGLLSIGTQMFPSLKWSGEETLSGERERSVMKDTLLKQKSVLSDVEIHLARVIKEGNWNFESYKILNTEEQIKLGVPAKEAVMADCILLFHKKAESIVQQ